MDKITQTFGYVIQCLIICDDVASVRSIAVGWPGAVHNNRVWENSYTHLYKKGALFLQSQQPSVPERTDKKLNNAIK